MFQCQHQQIGALAFTHLFINLYSSISILSSVYVTANNDLLFVLACLCQLLLEPCSLIKQHLLLSVDTRQLLLQSRHLFNCLLHLRLQLFHLSHTVHLTCTPHLSHTAHITWDKMGLCETQ